MSIGHQTEVLSNMHINMDRFPDLPRVETVAAHTGVLTIVGASPGVAAFVKEIKQARCVVAINAAHDWLRSKDITPEMVISLDCSEKMLAYFRNVSARTLFYLASACSPKLFDHLEGHDMVMWHPYLGIGEEKIADGLLIGGGCTAGLRAINVGIVMGYRRFDLYGVDSSYTEQSHVDGHRRGTPIQVTCAGRTFTTSHDMAAQADSFVDVMRGLAGLPIEINVHGDGLIPHIWKHLRGTPCPQ